MIKNNVEIVHEWLDTVAGSEKVYEQFLKIWPDARSHVLVNHLTAQEAGFLNGHIPETSFIQKLPFSKKLFRYYLPFFPIAMENMNLSEADIIVSSAHAVAKGVLTRADQMHVSYVHTPMRYAWDLYFQYLEEAGLDRGLRSILTRRMLHRIRVWDVISANRVDYFIANSKYIAERIFRVYRREAAVIYPPVDTVGFGPTGSVSKDDYFLAASRFVPYKRMDTIAQAFKESGRKLIIVGDGSESDKVQAQLAANITWIPFAEQDELVRLMQSARAFIFNAEEDFGIFPVEAQAAGTPVIAYGKGGSLETVNGCWAGQEVTETHTGVWHRAQDADSINKAVDWFEENESKFSREAILAHAASFNIDRFQDEMRTFVELKWDQFKQNGIRSSEQQI